VGLCADCQYATLDVAVLATARNVVAAYCACNRGGRVADRPIVLLSSVRLRGK
jgi:hypothetical protein